MRVDAGAMVREKIERKGEYRIVVYDKEQWSLLRKLRQEALKVMEALVIRRIFCIVHGSIARGDVHVNSDIDVFIPEPISPVIVEIAITSHGFSISHKTIVQATPYSTPKAYISLDSFEKRVVSFPLAKLSKTEYEFYYFGGALDYEGLLRNNRVPGVNKKLLLIEPTSEGHIESPVIGREAEVAKKVGISIDTVIERVRVLSRRDIHGRTGVFIKTVLSSSEPIEEAVKKLADENPVFRRFLITRNSPFI